ALLSRIDHAVAAHGHLAGAVQAEGPGPAGAAVGERNARRAGVRDVVAGALALAGSGRRARGGVSRFAGEHAGVLAAVPPPRVAVIALPRRRDEPIAAGVVAAPPGFAYLAHPTGGAVAGGATWHAGVLSSAGLRSVARVHVIADRVALDRALGARDRAVVVAL